MGCVLRFKAWAGFSILTMCKDGLHYQNSNYYLTCTDSTGHDVMTRGTCTRTSWGGVLLQAEASRLDWLLAAAMLLLDSVAIVTGGQN